MGGRGQYCKQVKINIDHGGIKPIWGDDVNIASKYQNNVSPNIFVKNGISEHELRRMECSKITFFRMDSTGVEGRIQVNERTRDVLKQVFL